MSAARILETIGGLSRPLTERDLRGLSGLRQIDRRDFLELWTTLTPERRTSLAREMVELSEESVELDLSELWTWLLDDTDATVRASAVEGLWENTAPRTMRRMLVMMRNDTSEEVRAAAAVGLSRFGYMASLGELDDGAELLERDLALIELDERQPQEVRRRALESAGYFAENEAVQHQIERDFASDEQLLQESALVAMGRAMLPRWLPQIGEALRSESPALRYEAARAAGELADGARGLLPRLARLMTSRDTEIALAAIWSMGQIGGDVAEDALQQVKRSEDEARSQAATEALEELKMGKSLL
ncbi:MAG: HEAT repeat domain-containing protein [Roseiflexaceae bacterium]|nr:HEAT repeat domain-containing protein [Roseiflexaceae bacterium]